MSYDHYWPFVCFDGVSLHKTNDISTLEFPTLVLPNHSDDYGIVQEFRSELQLWSILVAE